MLIVVRKKWFQRLDRKGLDARVQAAFVEPASYAVAVATREWRNMYKRVRAMRGAQLV